MTVEHVYIETNAILLWIKTSISFSLNMEESYVKIVTAEFILLSEH